MGRVTYRPGRNLLSRNDSASEKEMEGQEKQILIYEDEQGTQNYERGTTEQEEIINNPIQLDKKRQNTKCIENVKVMGDIDCEYHIYMEDYVYTYLYQFAATDYTRENSAALIGEIYLDSKEAIIKGIIPIDMDKLSGDSEWIDLGVLREVDTQRSIYFPDQLIIGWLHMQPGYGTMLTMKELREHQSAFEGPGSLCMLIDAINKIETLYVFQDDELKEQSGYCMYYERNEEMQRYMLEHPFTATVKQEVKDTVVNQFREIGKIRKAEYMQRKNLNLTVMAVSVILIALTTIIVRMNDSKAAVEAIPAAQSSIMPQVHEQEVSSANEITQAESVPMSANEANLAATAETIDNAERIQVPSLDAQLEVTQTEDASVETGEEETYEIYIVQPGDTLADISYSIYGEAGKSIEIAKLNDLENTNSIYVGQKLKLPEFD